MSAFDRAIYFTLRYEGGYVDNPRDPGGRTNYGISQRAYPELDIAGLTKDAAIEIYRADYWERAGCPLLPDPVAVAHFDCAVHSGISQAAKLLQGLVGAQPDGVLGPDTIARLASFQGGRGSVIVAQQLIAERVRFLVALERGHQRWDFIAGFMSRCFALAVEVGRP